MLWYGSSPRTDVVRDMQEPEKLEERLKELQSLLDKQKSSLTLAERKSRDLQQKLDAISKVASTRACLYFPATKSGSDAVKPAGQLRSSRLHT